MPLSTRIAPHLAYLRRYARAVTGSQASGDAYVSAVLEALITDPGIFPDVGSDRVGIYRLFATLFPSLEVEVSGEPSPYAWEKRAAANLARLPTRARQAFLLRAVEGFAPVEVAEILDVNTGEAKQLLARASEEISRQVPTEIMIIEDEPLIAMDIEQMVLSLGHTVTGIARTHTEAVELYSAHPPGMILADIQLADGSSGIDAVNELLLTRTLPVIFITAFPEHFLTGKRPEPAFLVTKPFNEEMVKALIGQALFFNEAASAAA